MRKRHWSHQGEKNRLIVLERDGYRCQIQGVGCLGVGNAVDHITPRILGGPEVVENLRATCKVCNSRKGRRMTELERGGGGSASKPIFSDRGYRRAPLLNTPPRKTWDALKRREWR